jgi:hypothetical protein
MGTLFTLAIGDVISLDLGLLDERRCYVVRQVRQNSQIAFCPIHETRTPNSPPADGGKLGEFLERCIPLAGLMLAASVLLKKNCRKLSVSPIGIVRPNRA